MDICLRRYIRFWSVLLNPLTAETIRFHLGASELLLNVNALISYIVQRLCQFIQPETELHTESVYGAVNIAKRPRPIS
jgi:hypothetical protein